MDGDAADRARLVDRLEVQSATAVTLGSPLYGALLAGTAADVAGGGPCWAVLRRWAHEPDAAAVPLRFMAAVHRLVLRRQAPALALHYPSVGGTAGVEGAWTPFRDTVEAHVDALVDLTGLPCQTNEVGRSAALGAAMAWLAARHGMPVHHREIGTSAGLNLRWDHFRYGTADGAVTWGPRSSPVDLVGHWEVPPEGLPLGLPHEAVVDTRQGCDPAPLDPSDAGDREGLTASVWADQADRHERLRGALAIAGRVPATVVQAGAGEWLADVLASRPDGLVVVSHSVVWRYIPPVEQAEVVALLEHHGARATQTSPLVWLRLEPRPPATTYDGHPYPILATTWPGGDTAELGTAQAHGQQVRWTSGGSWPAGDQ